MKKLITALGVLAVMVSVVVTLIAVLQRPPDGVEPIVWDQDACAHCHMHIGEPSFAAQLQTKDGQVFNFDDPGCLFAYIADNAPSIKVTYFHEFDGTRWLSQRDVGFIHVERPTPMGYGLGAVDTLSHPKALSFGDASEFVLTHPRNKPTQETP